jgi:DNA repair protein SbcD/Mre11
MFKFIHCADLHLDSPLRGLSAKPDAPEDDIRLASRKALRNLVDFAIAEHVNFIVIAGDIYDGDWQDYQTGLFFNSCMAKLIEYDIPVYLIRGNHDAASNITRRLVTPKNVIEFSTEKPETYYMENICVALHGQSFKQREVRDNLALHYPDPVPGYFNIGILHTCAEGQEGHENYAPCRVDELIQKGYNYWALGHIHKRQILHEQPYIIFPGNIQGRHIREAGEKGCTLVTVQDQKVTVLHHTLDVLRFYVCDVDLSGIETDEDFTSHVHAEIEQLAIQNPGRLLAIRVRLIGKTNLHGKLLEEMDRYLHEVKNAASMVVGNQIWIEKVKFQTEPIASYQPTELFRDAFGFLAQSADSAENDPDFIDDYIQHVKKVQARLGPYIKQDDALRVESEKDVRGLMKDAKEILLALIGNRGSKE